MANFISNQRTDCPRCGYKKSVASLPNGGFYCHSCSQVVGKGRSTATKAPKAPQNPSAREWASNLWDRASSLRLEGDFCPARLYLHARHIAEYCDSPALRYLPDCKLTNPDRGFFPALIAKISDQKGNLVGVQRIYLTADGRKNPADDAKKCLGQVQGGAVRLKEPTEDGEIVIGEGIETSAAAGLLLGKPAWAAVSAGNLGETLILPPKIKKIIIVADHDATGLRAAESACRRWKKERREVEVKKPDEFDSDAADMLAEAAHEQ